MSRCGFKQWRTGRRRRPPDLSRERDGTRAFALAAAIGPAFLLALILPAPDARATVVPWMSLEEMTGEASVVVLGSVEAAESRYSDDGRIIVTEVTLAVERPIKGGPRARVVLETPGGTVDGLTMVASGAPSFRRGDRVLLFLHPAAEGRPLAVVGWSQGRMPVVRDPQTGRDLVRTQASVSAYLDRQGKPVGPGRIGTGPVELQQLIAQIESLVKRGDRDGSK